MIKSIYQSLKIGLDKGVNFKDHTLQTFNNQDYFPNNPFVLYTFDGNVSERAQNYLWEPGSDTAISTDRTRYFTLARDIVRQNSSISDEGEGATWKDVRHVIKVLEQMAKTNSHIASDILPISRSLANSYYLANYPPGVFFHRGLTKDAGVLSNQGRASRKWQKVDQRIKAGLPTTDREYDDLENFVHSEGAAYALVPDEKKTQFMSIDRVNFTYKKMNDDLLKVDLRAKIVSLCFN